MSAITTTKTTAATDPDRILTWAEMIEQGQRDREYHRAEMEEWAAFIAAGRAEEAAKDAARAAARAERRLRKKSRKNDE